MRVRIQTSEHNKKVPPISISRRGRDKLVLSKSNKTIAVMLGYISSTSTNVETLMSGS